MKARLQRWLSRVTTRLIFGCWRSHGHTCWDNGKLRCQRCWLVVWDARVVRSKLG